MADPRNNVSTGERANQVRDTYKIDDSTITYSATETNGSAQVGLAVNFSAANTVQLVSDGEAVIGKLIEVTADDKAVVQISGRMTLPGGTAATLTLGKQIVGDLLVAAKGYIREVNTATAAELGVCRGFIIDAGTTTDVVVEL